MTPKDFKNRTVFESFRDAARGLWLCIKTERNIRFHTVVAAYVLVFAPFMEVTRGEYAAVMAVIALMISCEAFNTSIEKLCDYVCKNQNRMIGNVKDIAAGAVFISAIFAVCIGVFVFFKPVRLWWLITAIFTSPLYAVLLIASLLLSAFYVVKGPVGIKTFFRKHFTGHDN